MEGDAAMNNYYSIVKSILEIAKSHIFIKEAHYGDIYEFHNSGNRVYSTFVLTQGENNQVNENYTQYNFTAFVTDRLTDDENNLLEVQSNCATILNQIMIEIQDKLEYFSGTESMSFWKEKFNDLCAGCFITFSLNIPNDYICNDSIFMPRTITITENGEYNVQDYDMITVDVHSIDVLNYFTLYPSNYIYANYLDLSTEIVANVKFTGDEDFYFCSDDKGLVGLYFSAEENETYAWWDSDRVALHFHKSDWEKGFYKIIFKKGRLQIGYLTWDLGETKGTTVSYDPLYFGYKEEKTSPMEIEYITFVHPTVGQLSDFRPKIEDERAKLWDVTYDREVDIRTVYSQLPYEDAESFTINKYINTGIIIQSDDYKWEIELSAPKQANWFFRMYSDKANNFGLYANSDSGGYYCYAVNSDNSNVAGVGKQYITANQKHKFTIYKDKLTVDGNESTILFGTDYANKVVGINDLYTSHLWQLYAFKVWKGEELIIDWTAKKVKNSSIQILWDNLSNSIVDVYAPKISTFTTLEDTTEDMPIIN